MWRRAVTDGCVSGHWEVKRDSCCGSAHVLVSQSRRSVSRSGGQLSLTHTSLSESCRICFAPYTDASSFFPFFPTIGSFFSLRFTLCVRKWILLLLLQTQPGSWPHSAPMWLTIVLESNIQLFQRQLSKPSHNVVRVP